MTDLAARRDQLLKRLADLEARLQGIEEELDSHQSKDWEDSATEREDEEVLERLGVTGQQEIAQIKAALDRMDQGEYGFCVKCGNEISSARLDLLPYTPFCKSCAA
jgi:RNA polymerase-binding transcription factor DksA